VFEDAGPIDYTKPGPKSKTSMGHDLEYGIPVNAKGAFINPSRLPNYEQLPDDEFGTILAAYKTWLRDYLTRWPNAKLKPDGSMGGASQGLAPMSPFPKLQEAADPSKLIVSVRIEPMSTGGEPMQKEIDLTGQFQGNTRSQMEQAMDYLTKMLESKGLNFTTLQARYQGSIMNQNNQGTMAPQSDWEREAEAKAAQMRARRPAQNATPAIKEGAADPITQFASNAHEAWRRNFDPTGTKPRIKKNSDGTEGDINVPFADLHPDWQKENLAAGRAAQHAVKHFGNNMEKAAEFIHRQWMKRNPKADYNAAQHVPYDDLSDDEKEKDRVHVRTMMRLMGHQTNESGLRKFSHKKNRFRSLHKLQNPLGEEDAIDPSRRGFLKKAAGAAATGAAMSAAGPEIVTLVKGFAEQAGGMNGIQALKAMLKIATADELYNMYDYQADSGILADAITDSDMRALQRVKGFRDYEDWSDFEEYCEDNNDVNPVEEFERLTGRSLKVSLVNDILEKVDDTWSLEDFFDEYPDALKLINPFENGSISRPTMQQLAHIDKEAKGASLPAPIVTMANAVAGLVRQIFKSNGQPLAAPQQSAVQHARHTPALPAPTRPEFDITPDLKQKEKVPVQRKGDDEEQYYRPAPEHIQQALDAGQLGDKNFFQSIVDGTDKNPWVTPEKAQEILNKYYGPQDMAEAAQGHTIEAHGVRGMDRRTWHKTFRDTDQMIAWAEKHDAEIVGTRDLEQARHHNLSPAKQGVAEAEKNPHTSALGRALYRDLSKEKKASPQQVQRNKERWAQRQAEREQGVAGDLTEMDKSEPSAGRDGGQQSPRDDRQSRGRDTGPREGPEKIAKPITKEKMVKHALDALSKSMAKKDDKKKDVKESDTLMIKLKRALIKEGRVKELADDLKTMSDADFMKKYGKVKAAIRKDMKRVDEAIPLDQLRDLAGPESQADKDLAAKLKQSMPPRTNASAGKKTVNPLKPLKEGQPAYTPQEMSDILSGKKTQQQVDAERNKRERDDAFKKWTDAERDATRVDSQGRRIDKNGNLLPPAKAEPIPNAPLNPPPGYYKMKNFEGLNELSTNKLAQYKTAAAKDAKAADQSGDFKRGDKRLSGMVQATKKQFDNDAKKVEESRAARRALMARIVNSR